jgi:hypothetical protein
MIDETQIVVSPDFYFRWAIVPLDLYNRPVLCNSRTDVGRAVFSWNCVPRFAGGGRPAFCRVDYWSTLRRKPRPLRYVVRDGIRDVPTRGVLSRSELIVLLSNSSDIFSAPGTVHTFPEQSRVDSEGIWRLYSRETLGTRVSFPAPVQRVGRMP